ncbi:MAG TPA: sigma-54 dependent transcriptional regulator [Candidatus Hydrogenedentes bacterium]|nr:sigma-54 dependent transcriptional regulator [Candidatus Hydrogenedentota bacterium]HOL76544.1 sigma-54 dependent transcriptional regulator [Candidatus Hydrogenedentota bacterium]HPO85208.1 sigma-54 dependent transcriptional regulator [Candidatus Hydrogenedentota bacterium]
MSESNTAGTILLVDPDPKVAQSILSFLESRHYSVLWVDDGEKAYNQLDERPFDVLITELSAHRIDGMRLMAVARDRNPEICVILIAEQPDVERAVEAMRCGAYDFQTKPLNLGKLEAVIQRGISQQRLVLEKHELERRLDERYGLGSLIGKSRQMIKIYESVRQIAPSRATVLIQGETGTGKDLVAQAIHNNSPRKMEPFVKLNCANLPEALVESELFGHVAGAFTGAIQSRKGRFELADKGTLFLDEIGELSPGLQSKLLRVLEHQQFERLGDSKTITVDVRLIAATNRPLERMVQEGTFRSDLFYRLNVVTIDMPPLRHRKEDIPLLAQHFLKEACAQNGKHIEGITRGAMDLLIRYNWPGNVRELKNIIEGMVVRAHGRQALDAHDVPDHVRQSIQPEAGEIRIPTGVTMAEVERIVIEETMRICGYNKEACAKTLGIGLRTLYRKLKEYDIR